MLIVSKRHGSLLETVVGLEEDIRVLIMGKHGTRRQNTVLIKLGRRSKV